MKWLVLIFAEKCVETILVKKNVQKIMENTFSFFEQNGHTPT